MKDLIDEPMEMSLKTELRRSILSIKIDPLQIQAIKKVAAMKPVPYQILIRHWLSQNLKEELHIK
jgi:predicted DNA binding CopG/RHH family protein